jgi:hypothetical protein
MAKLLTAQAVEKLKPGAVRREVADARLTGLYLVIQPSGTKSWAVRCLIEAKIKCGKTEGDGTYPNRSLTASRSWLEFV